MKVFRVLNLFFSNGGEIKLFAFFNSPSRNQEKCFIDHGFLEFDSNLYSLFNLLIFKIFQKIFSPKKILYSRLGAILFLLSKYMLRKWFRAFQDSLSTINKVWGGIDFRGFNLVLKWAEKNIRQTKFIFAHRLYKFIFKSNLIFIAHHLILFFSLTFRYTQFCYYFLNLVLLLALATTLLFLVSPKF